MSLILEMPADRVAARSYAAQAILGSFLGLAFEVRSGKGQVWRIMDRAGGAALTMPDSFFARVGAGWLAPHSVPAAPLPLWLAAKELPEANILAPSVPVIAGRAGNGGRWWKGSEGGGYLGLDVFGSAFFLLSRYEEVALPDRDGHDRFPAKASLAARSGFLDRPILDEYVELLWVAMKRLWPRLERPSQSGSIRYTCDVDHPYLGSSKRPSLMLRSLAGDILRLRPPASMATRVGNAVRARRGDYSRDPNNTFDWLMDACEARGLQATFYFIAGHSGGAIDGCYDVGEAFIGSLLRQVHERGHRIGLHGSYNTYRDGAALRKERTALIRAGHLAGIELPVEGVRQHYLRWDSAVTPELMQEAGFAYDSTGSFADRAGFRYGTGRSFPMWGWRRGQALKLRQRPLVLMECSVIAPQYMNLGRSDAALQAMQGFKERCLRMGGDFTLLWHNSDFIDPWDRKALLTLLEHEAANRVEPARRRAQAPRGGLSS